MAIISKYDSKCKDCGVSYLAGEDIDTNGNKSPNKQGEMKDHWCKMGKNCQGAMHVKGTLPTDNLVTGGNNPADPDPEDFLKMGKALLKFSDKGSLDAHTQKIIDETRRKMAEVLIKRYVIEQTMNDLGLQHPSRIAFIKDVLS